MTIYIDECSIHQGSFLNWLSPDPQHVNIICINEILTGIIKLAGIVSVDGPDTHIISESDISFQGTRTVTSIRKPVDPGDATNKYYVDQKIVELKEEIIQLMKK